MESTPDTTSKRVHEVPAQVDSRLSSEGERGIAGTEVIETGHVGMLQ